LEIGESGCHRAGDEIVVKMKSSRSKSETKSRRRGTIEPLSPTFSQYAAEVDFHDVDVGC
jgi:hypothetical protein